MPASPGHHDVANPQSAPALFSSSLHFASTFQLRAIRAASFPASAEILLATALRDPRLTHPRPPPTTNAAHIRGKDIHAAHSWSDAETPTMTFSKNMGLQPPSYEAPYRTHQGAIPDSYIVRLQAGHTLEAHFRFLEHEPEPIPLDNGTAYFAFLHSGGLSNVREDPGVESVEDNTPVTGLGSEYVAPYHKFSDAAAQGKYSVMFREGHDVEKHFAFLGRRFKLEFMEQLDCYYAELDDELLAAVRRDPGAELVEQE